jgi:hypothetical protein
LNHQRLQGAGEELLHAVSSQVLAWLASVLPTHEIAPSSKRRAFDIPSGKLFAELQWVDEISTIANYVQLYLDK